MTITVGGLFIFLGATGTVVVLLATLFALFAQGMSDAVDSQFSWRGPIVGMGLCIALVLVGRFSGL